jgi:iron(III) transport system substrate-binding protein
MNSRSALVLAFTVLVVVALGLLALGHVGCGGSQPRVVLYCAQDREFADAALAEFKQRSGVTVAPKFDTEADKSVSLYVELVNEAEAGRPRCDVFWNNEILSTIRLQRRGLLEPYESPSAQPFPAFTRPGDRTWQAFAERARVLLVNTKLVPEKDWPRSLFDLTGPRFKDGVVMAKPQFGTTATQAACLFEVLGEEEAKRFYRALRDNGLQVVQGNKQVATGVGEGKFAVGMTDTDDAIAEVKDGRPVAIIFPDRDGHPDHPRMGTLFIPNTLALIKGGPHPGHGRKLIDFLLSAEVEKKLAESASHQMPLNPEVRAELPPQIETRRTVKPMAVDWDRAADLWDRVQTFLAQEIAKP